MNEESKLANCAKYQSKVLMIDLFRRPFNFLLPDHQSEYRTFLGSMLSVITAIFLLVYGGFKIVEYSNHSEFTVNQTRQNYYFDLEDSFSHLDGLAIAAGIIGEDEKGFQEY